MFCILLGNYITDFRQTARKVIANRDDRIIYGIGVTQCAKECVEEEGFSCASFDYCGNTTECRLSTASMKNIGQVSVIANLYCDVYSSKYNITFSKYNITFSKSSREHAYIMLTPLNPTFI